MAAAAVPVRSGCGGNGSCGLCRVLIVAGRTNPPTGNELERLTAAELAGGFRLACQAKPDGDVTVAIPEAPFSPWQRLNEEDHRGHLHPDTGETLVTGEALLGLAVDLGTTRIRLSLTDLDTGARIGGCYGPNMQQLWGSDIMTRLAAACESTERAGELGRLARAAIGEGIDHLCPGLNASPAAIRRVAIVGNSAMLTLLAGKNHDLLLKPAYWTSPLDCRPDETASWCASWGIAPDAVITVEQPLAGFVGSDLIAGVIATRLTDQPETALLVDFGTNSEIALWDGTTLWVTAAAGGPAFEGCGISCGMPAERGAIYRIEARPGSSDFCCLTLGDAPARGVCGTGLVDAIAVLRQTGKLRRSGLMECTGDRIILNDASGIAINRRDVDSFQRAKAAIAAAALVLLDQAGLRTTDLQRVLVGGAFGSMLHIANAQEVGLLPQLPVERFQLCGNCALAGCEALLVSRDRYQAQVDQCRAARIVNLAMAPAFESLFVKNLLLSPIDEN